MKKPLSPMSGHEFMEIRGALGLRNDQLAKQLGRSVPMTSLYASGRRPIPLTVAVRLQELLKLRGTYLSQLVGRVVDSTHEMLITTNTLNKINTGNKPIQHSTELHLMRRKDKPNTYVLPPYRLNLDQYTIYIGSLKLWLDTMRKRAQDNHSTNRLECYKLEIADLKAMAGSTTRHAPYDICITVTEWDVVSRALRHYHAAHNDKRAYALYQSWRRHHFHGPVSRLAALRNKARTPA